ncbi:uncharacterized protein [Mytilus edulis]|uniref:uncharacterized protein isoform X1 n=1 Tax=Mytilus edulis TaxID=6550 RepID=UPI0039F12B74
MKVTNTWWLIAIIVTYFSSTSSGERLDQDIDLLPGFTNKCRGRWAIHACYGGNGKRSGPPTDLSKNNQNDQLLLKKILLQNSDFNNYGIGNFDLSPSESLEERSSGNNGLEDLKTLSDLIQELIYRQRLRDLAMANDVHMV